MSVNSHKQFNFTGVGVMRDNFTVARNMFDIHVDDDGIAGYVVWQRNNFRIPGLAHLLDLLKRRSRNNKKREEAVKLDHRNFVIPYSEIQGVVTDDEHKEIQLLSSSEQLTIIFRPINDYEAFVDSISKNLEEKIFKRDLTKITPSVYI
ncbi:MAG: hypothetical protein ACXAD7_05910 [Candidatus Kariarchaeaceae archaeon]|jgi:hypothetical protein